MLLLLCFSLYNISIASAGSSVIIDNFDSYSTGDLGGQGSWLTVVGSGSLKVIDNDYYSAFNSITSTQADQRTYRNFTDTLIGEQIFRFKLLNVRDYYGFQVWLYEGDNAKIKIYITDEGAHGHIGIGTSIGGTTVVFDNLTMGVWHTLKISWYGGNKVTLLLDDTIDSGELTAGASWVNGLNKIQVMAVGTLQFDLYRIDDFGFDTPFPDTSTRIDTVTPVSSYEALATSTSFVFGATGYISEDDYTSDMEVRVHYENNGLNSMQMVGPIFLEYVQASGSGDIVFPVTSAGAFNFSTTTNIQAIGRYRMTTEIVDPSWFSLFSWFDDTLVSTSTVFLVSTSTAYDNMQTGIINDINAITSTGSSTACIIDWTLNFDLITCTGVIFSALFYPTDAVIIQFNELTGLITSKAPIGYFMDLKDNLDILSASSTPSFTVTIPKNLKTYIFNPVDTALASILWLFFAVNFYRRLKHVTL